MTLIVGLRGADGVVLASDSQATLGALKQSRIKLIKSGSRLVWGTSGNLAASQALYAELERAGVEKSADRETTKVAIREAMLRTAAPLGDASQTSTWFEGLFAWYSPADRRGFLLKARHDGHVEFAPRYDAVGSSRRLAEFGFFGLSRAEFLGYETLPLETVKMVTFMVAEDAVRASAEAVDLPIQMAIASQSETAVSRDEELKAVAGTVTAYRMHQLDFLKRLQSTVDRGASGLVPGRRGG